jgi:hypothetical protein
MMAEMPTEPGRPPSMAVRAPDLTVGDLPADGFDRVTVVREPEHVRALRTDVIELEHE